MSLNLTKLGKKFFVFEQKKRKARAERALQILLEQRQ